MNTFLPLVVIGCLLLTRFSSDVLAQTVVPASSTAQIEPAVAIDTAAAQATYSGMSTARPLVFDQERAAIRAQYRAAIQKYQQSYRTFTLARATYQQLGTLAALEDAVAATRQVLGDRVRVLIIFFDLLHLELRAGVGMDPERKQLALRRIETLRTELTEQEQLIANSQDRVAILARVTAYLESADTIETHSHYVRALLLTGRLYWGYQDSRSLYQEIKDSQAAQGGSTLLQAQRQRAYGEIDALIVQIDEQWQTVYQKLYEEGDKSQSWYQEFVVLLSQLQSDILRLFSYLAEVSQV